MLLPLVVVLGLALVRALSCCSVHSRSSHLEILLRIAVAVPVAPALLLVSLGAGIHVEIPRQHHFDNVSSRYSR